MNNRVVTIILAIIAVAAIVWGYTQQQQTGVLKEQVQALTAEAEQMKADAEKAKTDMAAAVEAEVMKAKEAAAAELKQVQDAAAEEIRKLQEAVGGAPATEGTAQ